MRKHKRTEQSVLLIICLALMIVLLAGCSGADEKNTTESVSGTSGSADAPQNDVSIPTEDKDEETPYGLSVYAGAAWEPRLGEERYDMLEQLNSRFFAAGIKTGEKDADGNDIFTYEILDETGAAVDSPPFFGYRSFIGGSGGEGFSVSVDENGARYDILYDRDGQEIYSTKSNQNGFVDITGYVDGYVTMKRFTEPDENGNRYAECEFRTVEGHRGEIYGAVYNKEDIWAQDVAPWTSEFMVVSSWASVSETEPGYANYIQYERHGRPLQWISIHLEDTNYVRSYPYAPNGGLILVQKYAEEADENGNRTPGELGIYNVVDGTYRSLGDYAGWGVWPSYVGRHPVNENGLVMLCETNQEPHRHAVYDLNTESFLLTFEDGYGEIDLGGNLWNDPVPASNEDRSSWTFLDYTFEEDEEAESYHIINTSLEPVGMWFDDVTGFSGGKAFVKAPDGLWYGIMDNRFSPGYENGEETRLTICTEGIEADDISVLGTAGIFAVKEGEQYRMLWFYSD